LTTSTIMAPGQIHTLMLIRHGESQWNIENRFTGWVDVPLAPTGIAESHRAANEIKKAGFTPDIVYTSTLKRAIKTAWNVLEDNDIMHTPVVQDWRLNERMYGQLQGLDKTQTVEKHGADQVLIWRRSYATPPPPMEKDNEFHPRKEAKYKDIPDDVLPVTESLACVVKRFMPLWNDTLVPIVKSGKKLMISAHGNTLRALVKHLDNIPEDVIANLNIPTSVPLLYQLEEKADGSLVPVKQEQAYAPMSGCYLGDQEAIKAAIEGVANQAGKK
jgi:2,3-bisphosphoglycerate-dependent phosphoglycerate mutase